MDDPGYACSLGLLRTRGSGVLSSTGALGGSDDELKVPVARVEGTKPSVLRVTGRWQPRAAMAGEARVPALPGDTEVMPSSGSGGGSMGTAGRC